MTVVARFTNMKRFCVFLAILVTTAALPLRQQSSDMLEQRASGNVKFYLYTRNNPSTPQQIFIDDRASVASSNFAKSRHTKIIIHGWGGSLSSELNPTIREAYLNQEDYNIISVDWNEYAKLNYLSARAKVPIVGADVAEMVDFLHLSFHLDFSMLVVIGHSLGAHVAGYCGKLVQYGKLAAIVGLDPAFPLYSYEDTETRLAADDAYYVETIQTNGNAKGFLKPIGSGSFYPNYGRDQNGCGQDLGGTCSHNRCVKYYVEALKGYTYAPVYKCNDYANITARSGCVDYQPNVGIGDPLHIVRVEGIYYFDTNDATPFGKLSYRQD